MYLSHIINGFVLWCHVSSILSSYITKLLHSYGILQCFERPMLMARLQRLQSLSCRLGFPWLECSMKTNGKWKNRFHKELKALEFGRISLIFFFGGGGEFGWIWVKFCWENDKYTLLGFVFTGLVENRIVSWEGTWKDLTEVSKQKVDQSWDKICDKPMLLSVTLPYILGVFRTFDLYRTNTTLVKSIIIIVFLQYVFRFSTSPLSSFKTTAYGFCILHHYFTNLNRRPL